MGREIRRVPPNWEHPRRETCEHLPRHEPLCFQPMYERDFLSTKKDWIEGLLQWEAGTHRDKNDCDEWWDWEGEPPNKAYYVPYTDKETSWYQLYETVSEGTPVSPAFETTEELINYLAENGDYWDQLRRKEGGILAGESKPWGLERAKAFVESGGWAMSFMVSPGKGIQRGVDYVADREIEKKAKATT